MGYRRPRSFGAALPLAFLLACGGRSSFSADPPLDPPCGDGSAASLGADGALASTPDATTTPDAGGASIDASSADAPDDATLATQDAPDDAAGDASASDASSVSDASDASDASACPPGGEQKLLAVAQGGLDEIALDADYVYFHDGTGVYRVPKAGGPTTEVATSKSMGWPSYAAFVVNDANVTFWQWNGGQTSSTLLTVPKGGGAATTLATVTGYEYFGIVAPSGALDVWGASDDLIAIDADGGVSTVTSVLPNDSVALAYDAAGDLFIGDGEGVISRFDGTSMFTLGSSGLSIGNIAVDADNIYVSGDMYLVSDLVLEAVVGFMPKGGGTFVPLFERTGTYTWMATDASYIYMTDRLSASVMRMQKNGVYQDTLVQTGGQEVLDIAVDDQCVYWTGATDTFAGVWTASKVRLF
jgi:hypothetical protein